MDITCKFCAGKVTHIRIKEEGKRLLVCQSCGRTTVQPLFLSRETFSNTSKDLSKKLRYDH